MKLPSSRKSLQDPSRGTVHKAVKDDVWTGLFVVVYMGNQDLEPPLRHLHKVLARNHHAHGSSLCSIPSLETFLFGDLRNQQQVPLNAPLRKAQTV